MLNITGEETRYVIYQEKPEVRDGANITVPLTYNSYNGAFNEAHEFREATLFESEEEVVQLATLQNQISQILKQNFNYIVVKQVDKREVIYSGKPADPEGPVDPENSEEDETINIGEPKEG